MRSEPRSPGVAPSFRVSSASPASPLVPRTLPALARCRVSFEGFLPAEVPDAFMTWPDSSPRLEPPSELRRTASPGRRPPKRSRPDPPLGFRPLQRIPGVGQPPHARVPAPWLVAPSGFRNLLTLSSAPHLPALFHAGPAPGVRPSELCPSRSAVRCFRRRTPPVVRPPRTHPTRRTG
jgi:hypothetical protein